MSATNLFSGLFSGLFASKASLTAPAAIDPVQMFSKEDVQAALRGETKRPTARVTPPGPDPDRTLIPAHWLKGKRQTASMQRAFHALPPSFVDHIAFRDWDHETGCFELSDGRSAGVLWELTPTATEGRDHSTLTALHEAFSKAVNTGMQENVDSPWISQWFVADEASLYPFYQQVENAIEPHIRATELSQAYLAEMDAHLQQVAGKAGIFDENGKPWRGRERRVFVTLYRHAVRSETYAISKKMVVEAASQFVSAFAAKGVRMRQCRGRDLIEWLTPFLNPAPETTDGDPYAMVRMTPFPDETTGKVPPEWDLGEAVLRSGPIHHPDGVWEFQGVFYTALTVYEWSGALRFGHMTGEHEQRTMMDELPEGTRMSVALIATPQYEIRNHLAAIGKSAVGATAESESASDQITEVGRAMADGTKLYRCAVSFTIAGKDREELNTRSQSATAVLTKANLPVYERKFDLFRSGAFIDHLPFGFNAYRDRSGPKRATLQLSSEIAKLLPVGGRSTGTGSACLTYFNRGAEPVSLDPIRDRLRTAHMTIFGPTGSGKSAALNDMLRKVMAVHRPWLWIVDPKWPAPSFPLLVKYFASKGLSVNHVTLKMDGNVSLNPFDQALMLLDAQFDGRRMDDDSEGERDLLGEMVILAIAMITGGEPNEQDRMRRSDRTMIADAIIRAAQKVKAEKAEGKDCVLTEDVVKMLSDIAKDPESTPKDRERASDMSRALNFFTQGVAGQLFNRPGTPWPEVDVTLVEFAMLGNSGYEDRLAVAFMSLFQAIQKHIGKHQSGHRPTVVVVDEVHAVAGNPMMGPYILKAIKTWRSAGAWYWQATQSVDDFKGPMKALVTQLEWFFAFSMPKDDVAKIKEMKNMNADQCNMAESATKAPGKYAEGVVIHELCTTLVRSVLSPMTLALAQTEQDERAARNDLMIKHGCSELDAVYLIAEQIAKKRAEFGIKKAPQPWSDRR